METPLTTLKRLNAEKPLDWLGVKAHADAELKKLEDAKRDRMIEAFCAIIRYVSTEMAVRLARELLERDHKLAFDKRFAMWCRSGDVYAVVQKLREELARAEREAQR